MREAETVLRHRMDRSSGSRYGKEGNYVQCNTVVRHAVERGNTSQVQGGGGCRHRLGPVEERP